MGDSVDVTNKESDMNTADMADEIARLRKERDELKRQLGRHTIGAGAAEQRMSESNAVRQALGFSADDEDVSPNDLRDAIARRDARMKAEALEGVLYEYLDENIDVVDGEDIRSDLAKYLKQAVL